MTRSYYRLYDEETDKEKVINLKLREADINEIRASSGLSPEDALLFIVNFCKEDLYVVIHDNELEAIFGVTKSPSDSSEGTPWFLSTSKFKEFSISFAKESRKVIREMQKKYLTLSNYVHSSHQESIEWLRWLGFFIDETPIFINEQPFYYFYKGRN